MPVLISVLLPLYVIHRTCRASFFAAPTLSGSILALISLTCFTHALQLQHEVNKAPVDSISFFSYIFSVPDE